MKFVYRDGSIVNFQFVRASFLQSYYVFNIAEGKTSLFSLRKVPFCKNLVDVNTRRNQYYNIIETLKKKPWNLLHEKCFPQHEALPSVNSLIFQRKLESLAYDT